ncbi:ParA family protein [Desulfosporosinus metallidurans]|uniref:Sporulation initiation inhibitor protein Soj n=1 Tax=Desulfosporosinus metallidurans TaxID=1888891 RepID=A0A1Q8R2C9_9FIRM|nr:AAA family ATPase [Desulfosporosinus metallidurans]OLN33823.1 Chromosome (plasmid) partitioning protein ParA [Desulfosporosinus metallidurans]
MIISIFNQKGGVGKSTTVTSLAAAMTKLGKKVLVVDMDPQANSTLGCGVDDESLEEDSTIFRLLKEPRLYKDLIESLIIETQYGNLHLLASDISLSDAEIVLANAMSREHLLSKVLRFVEDDYDYILIDCPPALSLLSLNALVASDKLIIPLKPGYFSSKAIKHLLETVNRIQENLKPDLRILGILITQYDARKKDLNESLPKRILDYKVFETHIRVDAQVEYAQENMMPIPFFNGKSKASEDYMNFAEEVIVDGKKERQW